MSAYTGTDAHTYTTYERTGVVGSIRVSRRCCRLLTQMKRAHRTNRWTPCRFHFLPEHPPATGTPLFFSLFAPFSNGAPRFFVVVFFTKLSLLRFVSFWLTFVCHDPLFLPACSFWPVRRSDRFFNLRSLQNAGSIGLLTIHSFTSVNDLQ